MELILCRKKYMVRLHWDRVNFYQRMLKQFMLIFIHGKSYNTIETVKKESTNYLKNRFANWFLRVKSFSIQQRWSVILKEIAKVLASVNLLDQWLVGQLPVLLFFLQYGSSLLHMPCASQQIRGKVHTLIFYVVGQ